MFAARTARIFGLAIALCFLSSTFAGMGTAQDKKEEKKNDTEWSDKVSKVRNRLTGKKRESKERWNRFAGTSDGGGRGL